MFHRFKTLISLAFLATLFAGCANQYNPIPQDTILENRHECRPNWIDSNDSYCEQGLSIRTEDTFSGGHSLADALNRPPLTSVYFTYDHIDIKPAERNKLVQAVQTLQQNPTASLLVVGKCDWHGTEEYNASLGDRRANSVKSYLVELGLNPMNIRTLSKGSLESTFGLSVEDAWQDRRVDIIVL